MLGESHRQVDFLSSGATRWLTWTSEACWPLVLFLLFLVSRQWVLVFTWDGRWKPVSLSTTGCVWAHWYGLDQDVDGFQSDREIQILVVTNGVIMIIGRLRVRRRGVLTEIQLVRLRDTHCGKSLPSTSWSQGRKLWWSSSASARKSQFHFGKYYDWHGDICI